MPRVSVIIPTYNSAQYLKQAVDSVLAQTYQDFEVLVIDDGSTDHTASLMKEYGSPVRYIRQNNGGVAVARNHGIEESQGEYVAFLDADDTWFPEKLEKQLTALGQQVSYKACYSAFFIVDSNLVPIGVSQRRQPSSALEDLLLKGNIIGSICTVVCERELFKKVGGFDPALSQCADWDMWVRLAQMTEFLYLDEPLVTYRQHPTNMSRNAPLLERDSLQVLEKGFTLSGLPEHLRERKQEAFARNYTVLSGTYFHAGLYRDFLRCAGAAMRLDFHQAAYIFGFPLRGLNRYRSRQAKNVS